jgi:methyl-accepting chemotaxis protein
MAVVDQAAARNAAAAQELSSTAEEVAAHATSLDHLVSFFRVERAALAAQRPKELA